jgi:molybdopterin synthase sulfur carrier subunit
MAGKGVRILYFAWLRARIGRAEEEVALPPDVGDVAGLLEWLRGRGGGYAEALRDLSAVRVAVNQDYAGPERSVRAGDEVALFPPMTGG